MLPSKFYGGFRTHNEVDLMNLKRICQCIEDRIKIESFDLQCILSMYKGKSIFSMQESFTLYNVLEKQIMDYDFEPDHDDGDNEIESNKLRRLFQVLMIPQPMIIDKLKDEKKDEDNPTE